MSVIGFISPPDWTDPTPSEFREIEGGAVVVQQTILDLPNFDWKMESIAACEASLTNAAVQLANAGCDITVIVGTPFGWAGLENVDAAKERLERISKVSGVDCISSATAISDALNDAGVNTLGLACTYYSDDWKNRWAQFLAMSGYDIHAASSMTDQGLMKPHGLSSKENWAPTPSEIIKSVTILADQHPDVEGIVITGAGARTSSILDTLRAQTGKYIIGSDTALYEKLLSISEI